jgi:formylglycine-generating enzyme required for sulfatase activity
MRSLLLLTLLAAAPCRAGDKIDWVPMPAGEFTMGSGDADETPRHKVKIARFEIARTPVTNAQYARCVAAKACAPAHSADGTCMLYRDGKPERGPLPPEFGGPDQPVVCVDWEQAEKFSEWAGGALPSEAQYEYAARGAGTERRYPWGEERPTCERAVIEEGGYGCGRRSTWPVCSKPKGNTPQGLCDIGGNVWEWVQDWYHQSYSSGPVDGSAWLEPKGPYRMMRGGCWGTQPDFLTVTYRVDAMIPGFGPSFVAGFRPVRKPGAKARSR